MAYYQGGVVDVQSCLGTVVANSTAEAEYCNGATATAASIYGSQLVNDMNGLDPDTPLGVPLLSDSKSAISISKSYMENKATRHILRRMHFARWGQEQGYTFWVYCKAMHMIADVTSKPPYHCDNWDLMIQTTETPVQL